MPGYLYMSEPDVTLCLICSNDAAEDNFYYREWTSGRFSHTVSDKALKMLETS